MKITLNINDAQAKWPALAKARIHSDGGVGDVENGLVEWERDVIAADWWVQLIYANYIMFKEKNVSEI